MNGPVGCNLNTILLHPEICVIQTLQNIIKIASNSATLAPFIYFCRHIRSLNDTPLFAASILHPIPQHLEGSSSEKFYLQSFPSYLSSSNCFAFFFLLYFFVLCSLLPMQRRRSIFCPILFAMRDKLQRYHNSFKKMRALGVSVYIHSYLVKPTAAPLDRMKKKWNEREREKSMIQGLCFPLSPLTDLLYTLKKLTKISLGQC